MTESTETSPAPTPADRVDGPGPVPEAIQVYACPRCGSWWGSSEAPNNLHEVQNVRSSMLNLATEDPSNWGRATGSRAECQHCKRPGQPAAVRRLVTFVRTDVIRTALEQAGGR